MWRLHQNTLMKDLKGAIKWENDGNYVAADNAWKNIKNSYSSIEEKIKKIDKGNNNVMNNNARSILLPSLQKSLKELQTIISDAKKTTEYSRKLI